MQLSAIAAALFLGLPCASARGLTRLARPSRDEVGGNSHNEAPVWSDPLTHWDYYWDGLPEQVQEFYISTIPNLNQSTWDEEEFMMPDWSDMTDEQLELARGIGYTEWSWEWEAGCMPKKKSFAFWRKKEKSCADLKWGGQCNKELLCSWDKETKMCTHMCGGAGVPKKKCNKPKFKGKKVCRYVKGALPTSSWPNCPGYGWVENNFNTDGERLIGNNTSPDECLKLAQDDGDCEIANIFKMGLGDDDCWCQVGSIQEEDNSGYMSCWL